MNGTRKFGWLGVDVPVIGQGTWNMESGDRGETIRALQRGLDLGLTHIDTAELYGSGLVERGIVRDAIAGRRDQVFLVSKVMPEHASYAGTLAACDATLDRLGTDHLDVYLLHWRGAEPLAETIRAFEILVKAGKIRAWGVSNFDVEDLEEALAIAGPDRIACNQVLYHLEVRDIETAVAPWCRARNIAVVGYSPFAVGDFPGEDTPGGRVLVEIAGRHGASARQVALRFLVRKELTFTIPKAAKASKVEDNARAPDVELTSTDLAQIEAAFPAPTVRRPLPMI